MPITRIVLRVKGTPCHTRTLVVPEYKQISFLICIICSYFSETRPRLHKQT